MSSPQDPRANIGETKYEPKNNTNPECLGKEHILDNKSKIKMMI